MTAASFSIGMTIATSSAAICSIGISPSMRAVCSRDETRLARPIFVRSRSAAGSSHSTANA
jgi:hypothetical protein